VEKDKVSVLICDDSALMRNLIGRIIDAEEDLEVAGKAMNGNFALKKVNILKPDVIILDLEMPEMNGIDFLKERQRIGFDIPVVILSSHAQKGARITMEALSLGASDFIMKPSSTEGQDLGQLGKLLVQTVRAYGLQYKRSRGGGVSGVERRPVTREREHKQTEPAPITAVRRVTPTGKVEVVALGISTGGPNALRSMFPHLRSDFPVPMVVVQHMPAGFTKEFAKSLDRTCPLEVKEAEEGDILKAGRILIAPGDKQMEVEQKKLARVIVLSDEPPVNGHRPSVGVLFNSVARVFGGNALAVIMTGMGKDGAREIGEIYNRGGLTLGQDEESSIVYGMPKVAWENGFIHQVVSLTEMAETLNNFVGEYA
jgi:two-component system, chemotaxis family, protein-glutamate methylesterase/glutaminase